MPQRTVMSRITFDQLTSAHKRNPVACRGIVKHRPPARVMVKQEHTAQAAARKNSLRSSALTHQKPAGESWYFVHLPQMLLRPSASGMNQVAASSVEYQYRSDVGHLHFRMSNSTSQPSHSVCCAVGMVGSPGAVACCSSCSDAHSSEMKFSNSFTAEAKYSPFPLA